MAIGESESHSARQCSPAMMMCSLRRIFDMCSTLMCCVTSAGFGQATMRRNNDANNASIAADVTRKLRESRDQKELLVVAVFFDYSYR